MNRASGAMRWSRAGGRLLLFAAVTVIVSCAGMRRTAISEPASQASGGIKRIHRLGLGPGDLVLESIRQFISDHQITDGAVLTGIGSLSACRLHWPEKAEYPPTDKFATFEGALEIAAIQGIIADGEPHLHIMLVEGGDGRTLGGHMEDGCKVLYLVELTIAEFDGSPMTRRPNEHGVKMLERK